jgi:hypothetical protein
VKVEKKVHNLSIGSTDMIEGLVSVLGHQLEQWVRGSKGLKLSENLIIESQKDDEVLVKYGFSYLGWVKKKDLETLKKMISDIEVWIRGLDSFKSVESKFNSLKSTRDPIRKELAGIRMRRIFAGKCKYCPI